MVTPRHYFASGIIARAGKPHLGGRGRRSSPSYSSWLGALTWIIAPLPSHLKNDFQLDRSAERKAGDAVHQAPGVFILSEDVLQQF
jgi:hypothetical protein